MASASANEAIEAALRALIDAVRAAYEAAGEDGALWQAVYDAKARLLEADVHAIEAAMVTLTRDPRWEARATAVQVLRYLVPPSEGRVWSPVPVPRALERACLVVAMAQTETDPRVRCSIVCAFVDLKADVGAALTTAFVCRFAHDPEVDVRSAVVSALSGIDTTEAIATLIALSRDPNDHVRDWACFGLGHQLGSPGMPGGVVDTDEIREALAARLDDPDGEASEEAATGLALRGDVRGVERMLELLARFDEDGITERVLMTASEAPDARYLPALEAIVEARPELRSAVEALDDCRAVRPRPTCVSPRHFGCACMRAPIPGLDGKR